MTALTLFAIYQPMIFTRPQLLLACLLLLIPAPSFADVTGRASVIDGDTIEIHDKRIRLFGIDAPEGGQRCEKSGEQYRCGQQSATALFSLIATRPVKCIEKDIDRYNRIVAECYAADININAWMVKNGWALAYRTYSLAYVSNEQIAKANKSGIWQGAFENPWDYRKIKRKSVKGSAPTSSQCAIKGNINSKGKKIYHTKESPDYSKVSINVKTGEKWFCNEEQAKKEGWVKAYKK